MDNGLSDLVTALWCLPWLIIFGGFVFIFLEWSSRGRGEANLHAKLFGEYVGHDEALRNLLDRKVER